MTSLLAPLLYLTAPVLPPQELLFRPEELPPRKPVVLRFGSPFPVFPFAGEGCPGPVGVGDVNDDGIVDVIRPPRLYVGRPEGGFSRSDVVLPLAPGYDHCGRAPEDIAMGDVDGDGDLDALLAFSSLSSTAFPGFDLWINQGGKSFTSEGTDRIPLELGGLNGAARRAYLLDLDDDGDLDAAFARTQDASSGGNNGTYFNDGSGHFTIGEVDIGRSWTLAFRDFDLDGDIDVVSGGEEFLDPTRLHRNDGTGLFDLDADAVPFLGFPALPGISRENTTPFAVDVDQDGDWDLFNHRWSSTLGHLDDHALINDGGGVFERDFGVFPSSVPIPVPFRVTFADLDGDGDEDLLGPSFYENDGGRYRPAPERVAGLSMRYGALADLDRDGDLDLFEPGLSGDRIARGLLRQLSAGPSTLGTILELTLHGPPTGPFVLYEASGLLDVDLGPAGRLLIHPALVTSVRLGQLSPYGLKRVRVHVPDDPALLGTSRHWQGFVGHPGRSTNVVTTTITGP